MKFIHDNLFRYGRDRRKHKGKPLVYIIIPSYNPKYKTDGNPFPAAIIERHNQKIVVLQIGFIWYWGYRDIIPILWDEYRKSFDGNHDNASECP